MALRAVQILRRLPQGFQGSIASVRNKSGAISNLARSLAPVRVPLKSRVFAGKSRLLSVSCHSPASCGPSTRLCYSGYHTGSGGKGGAMSSIKVSATVQEASGPVIIIGQAKNLQKLTYDQVKPKLPKEVTQSTYAAAMEKLGSKGCDTLPLYLNQATISQLPSKCSRHNTPTQAHAVTAIVRKLTNSSDESILIVCEKTDVFASACAVARAYPLYSKKTGDSAEVTRTINLEFLLTDGSTISGEDLAAMEAAIEGIRTASRIVDAPCMEMNVCSFLKEIETVAASLKVTPKIIRGKELEEKGFGGIWNVGKAATSLPALAVLSHTPAGATKTIAWVGKGIVYDTGGLSLKPTSSMLGMKRDCGGAAGILGAFSAMVKSGFKENLHAVFCLAENAVGPESCRPDDVITLYSGKTVEITNTDAEGRLVLGDGVAYARKDLKANIILDMATLTGAQGIATGKFHAAVVTNSSGWEAASQVAGRNSGDLVFPLPYAPEIHFKEFNSAVADMTNTCADRANAQSSCAGLFIESHIGEDFEGDWIHLDIASPSKNSDRATGFGVALLSSMFGEYSSNPLIKSLAPSVPKKKD